MARKNNLLSIGDISKYTGANIQSLRYYERIKLLEPTHTDPDSGYRYYSFEQIYLVEVIRLCIELDIPLKELTEYISEDDTVDYGGLLTHGKDIAVKKLETLKKGVKFISDIQQKIALTEKNPQDGQHYIRHIPMKYFCVTPCKKIFTNAEPFEVIKSSLDLYYYEDNYDEWLYSELLEYGFMCEHRMGKSKYYMFAELPKHIAMKVKERVILIPEGNYYCTQSEENRIEQTADIFAEQLKNGETFIAIETNVFTSRYKISKPLSELRILIKG